MFTHDIYDTFQERYTISISYEIVRTPELVRHGKLLEPQYIEVTYDIVAINPTPKTTEGVAAVAAFTHDQETIERLCFEDDEKFRRNLEEGFIYE